MSVPCEVQIKLGKEASVDFISDNPVVISELTDRVSKLLTGEFNVDVDGRCILDPQPWSEDTGTRVEACVKGEIGPVEIEVCVGV